MSIIPRSEPKVQETKTQLERTAEAIADMRRLHEEHADLQAKAEVANRTVLQLQDRVEMLQIELENSRQQERIVTRKLMRLAAAMSNMSLLAKQAEEIMVSVREWEQEATGKSSEMSAAEIVAEITNMNSGGQG